MTDASSRRIPFGVRPAPVRMGSRIQPTVHLLHGFVGAGKTTLARRLEVELPAVRLTIDEWVVSLYGHSPPEAEYPSQFARVESLIWQLAEDLARVNCDVILDIGFWSRESRELARDRVQSFGAIPRFYAVSCPRDIMKARTLKRSEDPPGDSMWIDEAAFEKFWTGFEPMGDDEECTRIDGSKKGKSATGAS